MTNSIQRLHAKMKLLQQLMSEMRTNYDSKVVKLEERNKMLKDQVKQQDFKLKRVSSNV
jgi:hypothetical protein